jgi:iron complex outermembrane recepter protein
MKKYFPILWLALFFGATHWALAQTQFTFSGRVLHQEDQEPLIGATVYLPQLRLGASTDVNGEYRIARLPAGTYTVQVSYVSHRTLLATVAVTADVRRDFFMENSAQTLEEVIVSGSSTKTVIRESPVPIAAVTQLRLLQQASVNLVDAVARMPGLSQVSTGAGLSKPIIRGLGFNRVITMHDGIRQEDNQWGEEHSIQIDEYSIDRYEIIRGAGSLMYGSDGLGGVLSVLSPRPVEEGKIRGRVLSNYQTNHGLLGLSAQVAGTRNGLAWLLQSSTKSSQNYQNRNDGRVFASNFAEPFNVNGFIGLNKRWGYSRLYFLRSFQRFNIINGLREATGRFATATLLPSGDEAERPVTDAELRGRTFIPYNSQRLVNSKLAWSNLVTLSQRASLTANLGYSTNRRSEYGDVTRPWQPQLDLWLSTLYYDVRYNLSQGETWELNLGSNGMYQRLDNQGFQVLYPNYNLLDNGLFAFGKYNLGKLKVSGGARYDRRQLDIGQLYAAADGSFQVTPQGPGSERFAGFGRTYQNLSASLGGVYEVSKKLAVRANVSRGFRAPTVPELSSNGVHAGTFRYEIGNLAAVPEVAYQADLGFTFESASWYVDVSLFQNSIQHYTFSERVLARSGLDSLFEGEIPVFRYTQGDARLRGAEATVTFNPAKARWFSFSQSYSSVFGTNRSATVEGAGYLPFMPPPRWISQVKLIKDRWGSHLANLFATVELEIHQAQNRYLRAYNTETATPAYQLVNMSLGGDVLDKQKRPIFSLYLGVNNLLDLAYQAHQSRLKYLDPNLASGRVGVFNMGRNLSVKIVVPFEGNWK